MAALSKLGQFISRVGPAIAALPDNLTIQQARRALENASGGTSKQERQWTLPELYAPDADPESPITREWLEQQYAENPLELTGRPRRGTMTGGQLGDEVVWDEDPVLSLSADKRSLIIANHTVPTYLDDQQARFGLADEEYRVEQHIPIETQKERIVVRQFIEDQLSEHGQVEPDQLRLLNEFTLEPDTKPTLEFLNTFEEFLIADGHSSDTAAFPDWIDNVGVDLYLQLDMDELEHMNFYRIHDKTDSLSPNRIEPQDTSDAGDILYRVQDIRAQHNPPSTNIDPNASDQAVEWAGYTTPGPRADYVEDVVTLGQPARQGLRGSGNYNVFYDDVPDGHFGEDNIAFHNRQSTRPRLSDSAPISMLEEIQSDWAKDGREYGYLPEPFNESDIVRPRYSDSIDVGTDDFDGDGNLSLPPDATVPWDIDVMTKRPYKPENMTTIQDFHGPADEGEMIQQLLKNLNDSPSHAGGIANRQLSARYREAPPPHPYGSNFDRLAIQRAMAEAVKNDSPGLAWPMGREQERRYGPNPGLRKYYDQKIPAVVDKVARQLVGKSAPKSGHDRIYTGAGGPRSRGHVAPADRPDMLREDLANINAKDIFYIDEKQAGRNTPRMDSLNRRRDVENSERVHYLEFTEELRAAIRKGMPLSILMSMIGLDQQDPE